MMMRSFFVAVFIAAAIMVYVVWYLPAPRLSSDSGSKTMADLDAISAKTRAFIDKYDRLQSVKISKVNWKKGGFDNVMIATFTFQNTNAFDVKDVEVTCEHFANSGTFIDRNVRTIYEVIKAKSSKRDRMRLS